MSYRLLLTLIILFSFQGEIIPTNPLHILLIAVPLVIQTYLIYAIGSLVAEAVCLEPGASLAG